jgi:hypothetical protein
MSGRRERAPPIHRLVTSTRYELVLLGRCGGRVEEQERSPIPFPVAVLAIVGFFVVAGWLWAIPFGWKVVLIIAAVGGYSWFDESRQ